MPPTGKDKGHAYAVTYATEDDWPVTSVRLTMRRSLPAGVAVHPRGAAPWSSGRISARSAGTGDGPFDKRFGLRAERAADTRFLGPDLRGALAAAIDSHPGLWLGNDGLVCVERGHLRDPERVGALLDELVALAALVQAAIDAAPASGRPRGEAARTAAAERERAEPSPQPAFEVAPAAAADPGDVQSFIQACFDRRVAAYEVNRRIQKEWTGRRVHGGGTVVQLLALGGHDFAFADLKGFRLELHVKGPEEIAPLVRVQLQVEESRRDELRALDAGRRVRFDGQLVSANPLLFSVQLVGATVSPAR
ncbi:MAG: hypothetical protein HY907_03845 [Deltaproteobacteria bacterium]|nr:hypothetical protein [Deltaproteobacteria bacterium]